MQPAANIRNYIAFRYPNWMDYARHMARVHHFEGWEEDLLNDVIVDLLQKPADKLDAMIGRRTRKIVNGAPTTELDKFVLKMMAINAASPVAPFRKNTLGKKIIARNGNAVEVQHSTHLNGYDAINDDYEPELNNKLDKLHQLNIARLKLNGFTNVALNYYRQHFIRGKPIHEFSDKQKEDIARIRQFLVVTRKTLLDDQN